MRINKLVSLNLLIVLVVSLILVSILLVFILTNNQNGQEEESNDDYSVSNIQRRLAPICWNRVITQKEEKDISYYWPDSCKGNVNYQSMMCKMVIVKLTEKEKAQYLKWLRSKYELDKRCYTANHTQEPVQICWNRVIVQEEGEDKGYYWPDGCKGNVNYQSMMCTMAIVKLTEKEKTQYLEWLKSKYELDKRCHNNNNISSEYNKNNIQSDETNKQTETYYSMNFVRQGNTKSNCVVAYKGKVYKIPEDYQTKHPGGSDKIINNCGNDISRIFDSMHRGSSKALNTLQNYFIGYLE